MNTTINIRDGAGSISTEFEANAAELTALLERVRAQPSVEVTGLAYDEFFEHGELTLQVAGVEDLPGILRLFAVP